MKRRLLGTTLVCLSMCSCLSLLAPLSDAEESGNQDTPIMPPEKTAGEVFKNIKVLNGMPQSQLYPTMRFMAASLGFGCGDCHVINGFIDAPADGKPEKQTARQMIKMVIDLNRTQFQGNPMVTCYTCHGGHRSPQRVPSLPLSVSGPQPAASANRTIASLPSADEILHGYLIAIGGKAAIDRVTSLVMTGATSTATGQDVAYRSEQLAPDKGHEAFALPDPAGRPCAGDSRCEYERVIDGRQGWLKSGGGVQQLVGQQFADQKLTFPLFQILRLKDQYVSFRVSGHDQIDGRDVYLLSAVRADGKSEGLYFDVESGLLRRRRSYLRTLIATIPQQTDFSDYREVDGVRLPFAITMSYVDAGSRPISRKFSEIKLNVPLPRSTFDKPH